MNNGVARVRWFPLSKRDADDTGAYQEFGKEVGGMELWLVNRINGTAVARNVEAVEDRLPARGIAVEQGTTSKKDHKR